MKNVKRIFVVLLSLVLTFSLCACSIFGDDSDSQPQVPQKQTYTIQYTDDTGVHSIQVQEGSLYSLQSLPQKNGYKFTGLFDAEIGGTQYITAGGSSVTEFTDNRNIVLYPQFQAKEYTLVLDYQGADITGSRSIKAIYDTEISELPLNLTLENKVFQGWYTEPDRKGKQIADQYGLLPESQKMTEKLSQLSDSEGNIKLYAGFKLEEFTVTFYVTDSSEPVEIKAEYGTPIAEVAPDTRVDGKVVISWSKNRNDTYLQNVFNGKVTGDMVLYASELAPVIDFNSNGGSNVNSIIAHAGDTINLPVPTKANYKFIGWQTASGNAFTATSMPSESIQLIADWQAMILFDTNGGTSVENISEPQDTKITLPQTEKTGYVFAGWYDSDGNQYTSTAMPLDSVKLCAKYWKIVSITKVCVPKTVIEGYDNTLPSMSTSCNILDLSDLYNKGVRNIKVKVHYETWRDHQPGATSMIWYSEANISGASEIWGYTENHPEAHKPQSFDRENEIELKNPKLYICRFTSTSSGPAHITNFYVQIEYTDMSKLY